MKSLLPSTGRTGVFSLRNVDRHVCRCLGYEFEDCITSFDDATLYAPEPGNGELSLFERATSRILQRMVRDRMYLAPKPQIAPLSGYSEHELLFVFCQTVNDIRNLAKLPNWRRKSQKTACWIDEIWLAALQQNRDAFTLLKDFDFIFVTFEETASYLRAKGFNAHHIPAGIDCLRFCPVPGRQLPRSIDVLAMGRKPAETHRELFELAQHDKINYVYDTSSLPNVKDHVDHRTLMAKQVSRSKFFFVQRAKADVPHETQGQVELGSRYFEGCAAGAILVGERLDVQAFQDQFGWKDSVIQLDYNSSDISPIMKMLMADQGQLDQIHQRNVRHSLLMHDWSYRWESMLKTMGMEPSESLLARQNELRQRAFAIPTDDELSDTPSSVA